MSTVVVVSPTTTTTQETEPTRTITFRANADQLYGRQTHTVIFDDCPTGLGIKIIGGTGEEEKAGDFGIFIKRILFGGLAGDGRLQEGDQILDVNGESLEAVTNKEAVAALRRAAASNYIKLIVTRDKQARAEFEDALEVQGAVSCGTSSTTDQGSVHSQSHSNTPPVQEKKSWSSPRDALSPGPQLLTPNSGVSPTSVPGHPSLPPYTPITPLHAFTTPGENRTDVEYTEYHSAASTVSPPHAHSDNHITTRPLAASHLTNTANTGPAASTRQRALLLGSGMTSTPQGGAIGFIDFTKTSTPFTDGVYRTSTEPAESGQEPSPISIFDSLSDVLCSRLPSSVTSELSPSTGHDQSDSLPMPSERKSSLGPQDKLKVEKLEVALRYLGLDPTPAQQAALRRRMHIDSTGSVTYGEFVHVARQIFKNELEERNFGPSHPFMAGQANFTRFSQSGRHSRVSENSRNPVVEERDQLREEVHRLRLALREKEQVSSSSQEELLRVRQEAQTAMQESRSLRNKVHLAEQAQRAANSMEHDYEEVVRLLEVEVNELKAREGKTLDHPIVQKRLAVLSCQLRKAELSKKTYEVATEKLLQFTEAIHEVLSGQGDGVGLRPDQAQGEPTRGGRPTNYLGKHKRHSPQSIANEAREVIKAVKSLIEVEPLPFGWDEAYTEDGLRYYINHVTQVTSWVHPLSNVEHTSRPSSAQGRGPPPPMPPPQQLEIAEPHP